MVPKRSLTVAVAVTLAVGLLAPATVGAIGGDGPGETGADDPAQMYESDESEPFTGNITQSDIKNQSTAVLSHSYDDGPSSALALAAGDFFHEAGTSNETRLRNLCTRFAQELSFKPALYDKYCNERG